MRLLCSCAIILLVAIACSPAREEPLPTLAQLPSLTPSAVPSDTPTTIPTANQSTRVAQVALTDTALAPTATPTETVTPSRTATITATATITSTPTLTPSLTPTVTYTPNAFSTTDYYALQDNINVRSCASTDCERISTLFISERVGVITPIRGEEISGNDIWYEIVQRTRERGFVHSSFLGRNLPSVSVQGGGASSGNPLAQPISPIGDSGSSGGPSNYSCNCSRTCSAMSCEEAYFQLNQCGCSRRDGDGDGVPCENVCPGG